MLRAEPEPVVGPRFSRAPWAGWAAGARRTPPRGIFPFFVGAEPEAAAGSRQQQPGSGRRQAPAR